MLMRPTIQKFNLDIQNYNYVILKWGLVSFFFFRFPFSAVPMSCQLYSGSLLYYFLFDSDGESWLQIQGQLIKWNILIRHLSWWKAHQNASSNLTWTINHDSLRPWQKITACLCQVLWCLKVLANRLSDIRSFSLLLQSKKNSGF